MGALSNAKNWAIISFTPQVLSNGFVVLIKHIADLTNRPRGYLEVVIKWLN